MTGAPNWPEVWKRITWPRSHLGDVWPRWCDWVKDITCTTRRQNWKSLLSPLAISEICHCRADVRADRCCWPFLNADSVVNLSLVHHVNVSCTLYTFTKLRDRRIPTDGKFITGSWHGCCLFSWSIMKFLRFLSHLHKIDDNLPPQSSAPLSDGKYLYKRLNQVTHAECCFCRVVCMPWI